MQTHEHFRASTCTGKLLELTAIIACTRLRVDDDSSYKLMATTHVRTYIYTCMYASNP